MTAARVLTAAVAAVGAVAWGGCGRTDDRPPPVAALAGGDLACGDAVAIEPVAIENCAWCSFDDYPTGRAPLPAGHPLVLGAVDLRALTDDDCAPLDPADAALVGALRAAVADATTIARQRAQACHGCPGAWTFEVDGCGLPVDGEPLHQLGTGCGVEVSARFQAICACAPDGHGPAEICGDGRDNDGDGLFECEDPGCLDLDGACDSHETACADGEDDDHDGADDCADPDCATADGCRHDAIEGCRDGTDDDGDGLADCDDDDCAATILCAVDEDCGGGGDDDGDGLADCADDDCAGFGACGGEIERCGDGDDDDGDGLIDCADDGCAGTPLCTATGPIETDCAPGIDRDGDGLAGCADPDCGSHPTCWLPCGDASGCWY